MPSYKLYKVNKTNIKSDSRVKTPKENTRIVESINNTLNIGTQKSFKPIGVLQNSHLVTRSSTPAQKIPKTYSDLKEDIYSIDNIDGLGGKFRSNTLPIDAIYRQDKKKMWRNILIVSLIVIGCLSIGYIIISMGSTDINIYGQTGSLDYIQTGVPRECLDRGYTNYVDTNNTQLICCKLLENGMENCEIGRAHV